MKHNLLELLLFFAVFAVLSLPVAFVFESKTPLKVSFQKNAQVRGIAQASVDHPENCQWKTSWRHKCKSEIDGKILCQQDRLQKYLDCKKH